MENTIEFATYPSLTKKLDSFSKSGDELSQEMINEIVLWKIGRYADVADKTDVLKDASKFRDIKYEYDYYIKNRNSIESAIKGIMTINGCGRIAMTSTILRFINPNLFQIIDQRMMRILYGNNHKANSDIYEHASGLYSSLSQKDAVVKFYIDDYLAKLHEVCDKYSINFCNIDRVLFVADQEENGKKMIVAPRLFIDHDDFGSKLAKYSHIS